MVAAATPAMAEDSKGGFKEVNVITIEEAQNLGDDAYVIIQGNITNKIGDENILFKTKPVALPSKLMMTIGTA